MVTDPPARWSLYDTTNTWGFLGELYAMAAGNLASHFGQITAEPVADYVSGQVNDYTATIYLGSTYDEPIPAAFLNDVLSTARPVIWAGDNIWQLTGSEGSAADTGFESVYGWDPSSSYFDSTDNPPSVSYKGQTFTRNAANGADLLAPHITNPSLVTVLAQANCTGSGGPVNCASIAQSSGTSFPWAIRSSNLTYVGEVPFSYISETDRYVAFSDLLFPALNPAATPSHLALVRLEDVNADVQSGPARRDHQLPVRPGRAVQHQRHPAVRGPERREQQRRPGVGEHRTVAVHGGGPEERRGARRHSGPGGLHPPVLQRRQPVQRGQR